MTVGRGSDEPADPRQGPPLEPAPDLARITADLETRAGRLQRFVEGLATVLDRFEAGARSDDPANLLADFEVPDASHEALRVISEASTATRHDLAVLRTDIHALIRARPQGARPAIVGRIQKTGLAATTLKVRFEVFQLETEERLASRGAGPSGPGGPAAQSLQQFVVIAVRTLHDVAEGAALIDSEDGHLGLLANAAPRGAAARTVVIPPPPRNAEGRRPAALLAGRRPAAILAMAAAGGAFTSWAGRIAKANGPIGPLAAGGAIATVVLIAVVASSGGPTDPGSSPSPPAATGAASPGGSGGVADASASPGSSEPAVSLLPGQTAPPTLGPGTSLPPGATPGPSVAPSTPPPPPPPTPAPPPPTLDPGAAADQFAARITAGANNVDALLGQITVATQAGDFSAARATAQTIENLAAAERAWLQSHPPAACYETHHTTALTRYAELIATAVEIQADADAGNANAIYQDLATGHNDVAALKLAANKAAAACP